MKTRRWILAGAVAGSIGLGAALGVTVLAPVAGGAAEGDGETGRGAHELCVSFPMLGEGPLAVAADTIGIEPEELLAGLRDGRTVAEIAEENGVTADEVVDAVLADARDRLDQAVADGRLPEEQADRIATHLEEHVTAFVNGDAPPFPRFRRGAPHLGWGFGPGDMAGMEASAS